MRVLRVHTVPMTVKKWHSYSLFSPALDQVLGSIRVQHRDRGDCVHGMHALVRFRHPKPSTNWVLTALRPAAVIHPAVDRDGCGRRRTQAKLTLKGLYRAPDSAPCTPAAAIVTMNTASASAPRCHQPQQRGIGQRVAGQADHDRPAAARAADRRPGGRAAARATRPEDDRRVAEHHREHRSDEQRAAPRVVGAPGARPAAETRPRRRRRARRPT